MVTDMDCDSFAPYFSFEGTTSGTSFIQTLVFLYSIVVV